MIDLIIPYYNNPQGIMDTLNSINFNIFNVTIVDDGSNNYLPPTLFGAQVFRYNDNRGPGRARQWGLDHTNNPYVMFIDTGDIFISKEIQEYIANVIQANPSSDVISFSYYYKDQITSDTDNRMHGKVYKREFLNKYNIRFAPEGSYLDEDIGFNHACRMCTDILFMHKPVIRWIENENSLTQKNNQESLYKNQTRALSINIIHAIENCRNYHVNISHEIYQITYALYYWIVRTIIERPEFAKEAWSGAKIFFDKYVDEIDVTQLVGGNAYIKKLIARRDKIRFPINILRFIDDMKNFEIIPDKYLT